MTKIFRKLTIGVMAIAMLFSTLFVVAGCNNIRTVFAWYEGDGEYGTFQMFLNAGETYTVRPERFHFLDVSDIEKIELVVGFETHDNVVSVQGDTLTAINNGRAEIVVHVHRGIVEFDGSRFNYISMFRMGEVRVLDVEAMTEIRTAQDLANMNNDLEGSFVLRADIDLEADWEGDWIPIGPGSAPNAEPTKNFRGAFINPDDHEIKNLSISRTLSYEIDGRVFQAGLFGYLQNAFICGIILEAVNIVALGEHGANFPRTFVGGITGGAMLSTIQNSSVSGNIVGNHRVGGIVGSSEFSEILNCHFDGNIELIWHDGNASAGGIAGSMFGVYNPP